MTTNSRPCDFCTDTAVVDAQMWNGSWANLCEAHRKQLSVGGHLPAGVHSLDRLLNPPTVILASEPDIATLWEWEMDGIAYCQDGCQVEPDNPQCEHGSPNWLRIMGLA